MTLLCADADPEELTDGSLVVEHDVREAKAAKPIVMLMNIKFGFINILY
jgi:hypothetical protein